ncbi:MAG: ComEA family DNA-binding protein [Candidatus Hydrothermia bacterium]
MGIFLIAISMALGAIMMNRREGKSLHSIKFQEEESRTIDNIKAFEVNERQKININNASYDELLLIPGIGPKFASEIIRMREKNRFTKVEDLMKIKGIGPKKIEIISRYVEVK